MKIGLIGFGSIGKVIAKNIGDRIIWVVDIDRSAEQKMRQAGLSCPFYASIPDKCGGADLVVEAASTSAVPMLADCLPFCDVMVLSVGAFADEKLFEKMLDAAIRHKRKIYLPSGAIGGMDAISAISGKIGKIALETIKPPSALGRNDKKRVVVFEGSARKACKEFPKNINVAATLSLAGAGFDKTAVRIISDPKAKANTHRIIVSSPAGNMRLEFENVPSDENPKTSALAALSAINRILKIEKPLQIG